MSYELAFQKQRHLLIASMSESMDERLRGSFVTLFPAYRAQEEDAAESLVGPLVQRGCVEFCCVGPLAEKLHDTIDALIESAEAFHVVTTWHESGDEACEYFLAAAGGTADVLVAFVADYPDLVAALKGAM
jgi:hypothetical protein